MKWGTLRNGKLLKLLSKVFRKTCKKRKFWSCWLLEEWGKGKLGGFEHDVYGMDETNSLELINFQLSSYFYGFSFNIVMKLEGA
jgi:hypothetical protein